MEDIRQKTNINLPSDVAEGTYANLVLIAHSQSEFVFDFIRVMPNVQNANVKARVILTPEHAKRLLRALAENLDKYESEHGEIKINKFGGHPMANYNLPKGGEA